MEDHMLYDDRRDAQSPFASMTEEFAPIPPRNLESCTALRLAGYKPHARVCLLGRELECISYPFPQDGWGVKGGGVGIGIMLREPSDPTTMFEWSIPRYVVADARRTPEFVAWRHMTID